MNFTFVDSDYNYANEIGFIPIVAMSTVIDDRHGAQAP